MLELLDMRGRFTAVCYGADGRLKWKDSFPNTVMTLGKNLLLDTFLAGAGYTVTGPFMGLISSVGFPNIQAYDTMTFRNWTEAGLANAPTYSGNRKTAVFAAASGGSKALSALLQYSVTSTGIATGGFIVLGTGALNTKDNTAGTLFSAGLFTGGDRTVINGDIIYVNYTLST